MFKPTRPKPLEPAIAAEARLAYRRLCEAAVSKQSNEEFRDYLASVLSNNAALDRHVRAFALYAPYLSPKSRILDWGCRHAPDACMIRQYLKDDVELHGCDTERTSEGKFEDFFSFAALNYQQLSHVWELPYDDGTFDVVLSSGVLEHVALQQPSVHEIWRILKTDGLFVITFLPNYYSLSERASRFLRTYVGHNRLYKLSALRTFLLQNGFVIEEAGYHQFMPTLSKGVKGPILARIGDALGALNPLLERVPAVTVASSNLYAIARKVEGM